MGSYNQDRSSQTDSDNNKEDEMKKVLILAATITAALSVGVATSAATPTTPGGQGSHPRLPGRSRSGRRR